MSPPKRSTGVPDPRDLTIFPGSARRKSGDVARCDVIRIEQFLMLGPSPKEREAGVSRVVQDRANGAGLPTVGEPMSVLLRPPLRRTWNAFPVQPGSNRLVACAVQLLGEYPPHHFGRHVINRQYTQPVDLGRFTRVRVRPAVDHHVPVRCAPALMPSLVDDLHVHRGPHPRLHVLPLGLAHATEDAHQHLVRRIARVVPPAHSGTHSSSPCAASRGAIN